MKKPPRFAYFPDNDKHLFPLLVHNRSPYKRFLVHWCNNKLGFVLSLDSSKGDSCDEKKLQDIARSAEHWLFAQIRNGIINRPLIDKNKGWDKVILNNGMVFFILPIGNK